MIGKWPSSWCPSIFGRPNFESVSTGCRGHHFDDCPCDVLFRYPNFRERSTHILAHSSSWIHTSLSCEAYNGTVTVGFLSGHELAKWGPQILVATPRFWGKTHGDVGWLDQGAGGQLGTLAQDLSGCPCVSERGLKRKRLPLIGYITPFGHICHLRDPPKKTLRNSTTQSNTFQTPQSKPPRRIQSSRLKECTNSRW